MIDFFLAMKNKFTINYHGTPVEVEELEQQSGKNTFFSARLPEGEITIERKEDDEGATKWLDAGAKHETPASTEVGSLIAVYMADNKKMS